MHTTIAKALLCAALSIGGLATQTTLPLTSQVAPLLAQGTVKVDGQTLTFLAGWHQVNKVTITHVLVNHTPYYRVEDSVKITPGPGCSPSADTRVWCKAIGITRMHLDVRNFDDSVRSNTSISSVMLGGAGRDTLTGGSRADRLYGQAGDDTLSGGGGNDELSGNTGDDVIKGDTGVDLLNGNDGADTMYAGSAVTSFSKTLHAGETLNGGAGDDTMYGESGNDAIRGEDGDDTLNGRAGNDRLEGGKGGDSLTGGSGDDTTNGGPGDDACDAEHKTHCES